MVSSLLYNIFHSTVFFRVFFLLQQASQISIKKYVKVYSWYSIRFYDDHCLSLFRYLLQIMMEANCLEIASLISVLLKDALALIRIVNAARSTPGDAGDKSVVTRLYQNLKALEAWAQSEW